MLFFLYLADCAIGYPTPSLLEVGRTAQNSRCSRSSSHPQFPPFARRCAAMLGVWHSVSGDRLSGCAAGVFKLWARSAVLGVLIFFSQKSAVFYFLAVRPPLGQIRADLVWSGSIVSIIIVKYS